MPKSSPRAARPRFTAVDGSGRVTFSIVGGTRRYAFHGSFLLSRACLHHKKKPLVLLPVSFGWQRATQVAHDVLAEQPCQLTTPDSIMGSTEQRALQLAALGLENLDTVYETDADSASTGRFIRPKQRSQTPQEATVTRHRPLTAPRRTSTSLKMPEVVERTSIKHSPRRTKTL